jgi:hypothetical protein
VAKKHRDDRAGTRSLVTHVPEELYHAVKIEAAYRHLSMDLLGHVAWLTVLDDNNLPQLEALHSKLAALLAAKRRRRNQPPDEAV